VTPSRVCRSSSSIYSSKKNALLARVRGPSTSRTRRGTRCRPLESCPFAGVPESAVACYGRVRLTRNDEFNAVRGS
jgi:hypothetical protein